MAANEEAEQRLCDAIAEALELGGMTPAEIRAIVDAELKGVVVWHG